LIARIPEPTGGIHEYMLDPDALTDDDLSDLLRAMEHYGPGGQSMHRSLISMLSPRLRLGVRVMPLSDALARALHAPDSHGLLVTAVVPGSPAMRAGISPGDVLLSLKGQALESAFHLEGRLNVLAGEIALGLLRAGVHEERIANLGPLPTREAPGGGLGGPGGR
jgi:membrane-associated protease RseP (regulator of RpoE activity)